MAALALLRHPVPLEKQRLLRARWASLDSRLRTPGQGFGQQATGCGATIGVHPGCDFACTGCYLGAEANSVAPIGLAATFRQLDRLRAWLGPKGNTQITDGEVTRLPVEDLLAILRYARRIGLIPMLMTHGDSFRRQPGLLERLMRDGGLTEVSIHVDTTQRGRLGYKAPPDEAALNPLRDEFADLIRSARRTTGLPLRGATTLTVTRDNLEAVPAVVDWCVNNRDAFGLLSFQPVAQVGRTLSGLRPITVDALWARIASALGPYGYAPDAADSFLFGHPDCTHVELFVAYERAPGRPQLVSVVRREDAGDADMLRAFFGRGFGGINFRDDSTIERLCRAAGIVLTDPRWLLGPLRQWVVERLREVGTTPARLAWDAVRHRIRLDSFAVVSHHFMSPAEIDTERGRERLNACLFRVPIGDDMVPMCHVNAGGVRESVYRGLS